MVLSRLNSFRERVNNLLETRADQLNSWSVFLFDVLYHQDWHPVIIGAKQPLF